MLESNNVNMQNNDIFIENVMLHWKLDKIMSIKVSMVSFMGSLVFGLLHGFCLDNQVGQVRVLDFSMGREFPKNYCSGVGSTSISITNRLHDKHSSLWSILVWWARQMQAQVFNPKTLWFSKESALSSPLDLDTCTWYDYWSLYFLEGFRKNLHACCS